MFTFRVAPLRTAAVFAIGFVALRVAYRIVFGGASGSGVMLADLPSIPLDGPFAHVTLLGPITTGGIGAAASSAVPFAITILGFGFVSSVINVTALFGRAAHRGPMRSLARAGVIAWASFPALVTAAGRVRTAAKLRGRRPGARLLVPIFEQTIERAIALAATLEARGFAADDQPIGDCRTPVSLVDAALTFGGEWRLSGLTLTLEPATLTVISGATGSGKSSLLHSMSGLFQHVENGIHEGTIEVGGISRDAVPPRNTASLVGVVLQNARLSFAAETVREELGFSLALRGESPTAVAARVAEVAHSVRVAALLDRPLTALSAGEAALVALGAALISHPLVLLVDEPLADLDDEARRIVCATLESLAHDSGVCVIVTEHNTAIWGTTVDSWWHVNGGSVVVSSEPHPDNHSVAAERRERVRTEPADSLARATDLSVSYGPRSSPLNAVANASLELGVGEIVAIEGPNGAGKSSLLHALALPRDRGTVVVAGTDVARLNPRERAHTIALVPERVDDLFFTASVADECRLADPSGRTERTFAELLGHEGRGAGGDLLARHPRDLSAGERVCLAIALQLAARPTILLIDEPTRALDAAARSLVGAAITRVASGYAGEDPNSGARQTAVLFATHDREFVAEWAHRTLRMDAGRLVGVASPTSSEVSP